MLLLLAGVVRVVAVAPADFRLGLRHCPPRARLEERHREAGKNQNSSSALIKPLFLLPLPDVITTTNNRERALFLRHNYSTALQTHQPPIPPIPILRTLYPRLFIRDRVVAALSAGLGDRGLSVV